MAAILRRLELVSHGATQAWNASGGGSGDPGDKMVTIITRQEGFPHLVYRERYGNAKSDRSRAAIVAEAQAELDAWVKREKPPESSITEDQIIVRDFGGWTPEDVAQARRVTPRLVRKVRAKAQLGTEDGLPLLPPASPGAVARAEQARELKARGLTVRQIAMHLNCGVGTVQRDLAA